MSLPPAERFPPEMSPPETRPVAADPGARPASRIYRYGFLVLPVDRAARAPKAAGLAAWTRRDFGAVILLLHPETRIVTVERGGHRLALLGEAYRLDGEGTAADLLATAPLEDADEAGSEAGLAALADGLGGRFALLAVTGGPAADPA